MLCLFNRSLSFFVEVPSAKHVPKALEKIPSIANTWKFFSHDLVLCFVVLDNDKKDLRLVFILGHFSTNKLLLRVIFPF